MIPFAFPPVAPATTLAQLFGPFAVGALVVAAGGLVAVLVALVRGATGRTVVGRWRRRTGVTPPSSGMQATPRRAAHVHARARRVIDVDVQADERHAACFARRRSGP